MFTDGTSIYKRANGKNSLKPRSRGNPVLMQSQFHDAPAVVLRPPAKHGHVIIRFNPRINSTPLLPVASERGMFTYSEVFYYHLQWRIEGLRGTGAQNSPLSSAEASNFEFFQQKMAQNCPKRRSVSDYRQRHCLTYTLTRSAVERACNLATFHSMLI